MLVYKNLAILVGIVLSSVLSSCVTTQSALPRGATISPSVSQAYVIVGVVGTEQITAIDTTYGRFQVDGLLAGDGVFIFPLQTGRPFSITQVRARFTPGRSERYAQISKPRFLPISESGIYYFGTIYSRYDGVFVSSEFNRIVVRKAEEKHPQLFEVRKPVNF